MGKIYTKVLCLRDFNLALRKKDLEAKKGDTVVVELEFAVLMERYGLGRIIGVAMREMEP